MMKQEFQKQRELVVERGLSTDRELSPVRELQEDSCRKDNEKKAFQPKSEVV